MSAIAKQWKMLYESLIILMVITYAILLVATPENHPLLTPENMNRIDWVVISVLSLEYVVRLIKAPVKLRFVKENWFDLVALMPIDSAFRLARLIRVVRLVRIMRASPLLWGVLQSPQIRLMMVFAVVVMLWSSTGIYFLENGLNETITSFGDALWWSVVTTTTVGYGDISPVTVGGRIIAVFLMLTGIGMIGTVTATLATHWVEYFQKGEGEDSPLPKDGSPNRVQQLMKRQAADWLNQIENLTEEEYRTLQEYLELLRKQGQGPSG